jgi:hypothetical protein
VACHRGGKLHRATVEGHLHSLKIRILENSGHAVVIEDFYLQMAKATNRATPGLTISRYASPMSLQYTMNSASRKPIISDIRWVAGSDLVSQNARQNVSGHSSLLRPIPTPKICSHSAT